MGMQRRATTEGELFTTGKCGHISIFCPEGTLLGEFLDGRAIRVGHPADCPCLAPTGAPAPDDQHDRRRADGGLAAPANFRALVPGARDVSTPRAEVAPEKTLAEVFDADRVAAMEAARRQEQQDKLLIITLIDAEEDLGRKAMMIKDAIAQGILPPDHPIPELEQAPAEPEVEDEPEETPAAEEPAEPDTPQEAMCAPVEPETPEVVQPPQDGEKWPETASCGQPGVHTPRRLRAPRSVVAMASVAIVGLGLVQVLVTSASVRNTS